MHDDARWCKMMQDGARWCKMMQDDARWCKMMQDDERWCKMMQDDARWCKMMQDDARWCRMMQDDARWCKMMMMMMMMMMIMMILWFLTIEPKITCRSVPSSPGRSFFYDRCDITWFCNRFSLYFVTCAISPDFETGAIWPGVLVSSEPELSCCIWQHLTYSEGFRNLSSLIHCDRHHFHHQWYHHLASKGVSRCSCTIPTRDLLPPPAV